MTRHHFLFCIAVALVSSAGAAWTAPLHDAARNGDIESATQLIQANAEIEALDESGETPLMAATLAGQTAMVQLLIDRGAKVEGRNEGGFTALHAAAYAGHIALVKTLIELGANINDQDNKAKITPLHAAAEKDYREIAELLIDRGARLDLKELNGWTPLARATFKRYKDMVLLLRRYGAECPAPTTVGPKHFGYCRDPDI